MHLTRKSLKIFVSNAIAHYEDFFDDISFHFLISFNIFGKGDTCFFCQFYSS